MTAGFEQFQKLENLRRVVGSRVVGRFASADRAAGPQRLSPPPVPVPPRIPVDDSALQISRSVVPSGRRRDVGRGTFFDPRTPQQRAQGVAAAGRRARNPLLRLGRFVGRSPLRASLISGAVSLGVDAVLGQALNPESASRRQARKLSGRDLQEAVRASAIARRDRLLHQAEITRLQNAVSRNVATIRREAPQLYNRLVAGQDLPDNALVFGGTPRRDLIEEAAFRMAIGEFSETGLDPQSRLRAINLASELVQ